MDKKAKKKLDVINQKITKVQQQLAGARQQDDEPGEVERLEAELQALRDDAARLKAS